MEKNKKRHNILVLSTGDTNGAYEGVYKLLNILSSLDHNVVMLVKHKIKKEDRIIQYRPQKISLQEKIYNKFFPKKKLKIEFNSGYDFISNDEFSENIDIDRLVNQIGFTPDFTFVGMTPHFINSTDLLNLYKKTKTQIYNITVDMNHFTGGCHFSWGCKKYETSCDAECPALKSNKTIAEINFNKKLQNAKEGNFKIIAGSGWTLNQAQNSAIYSSQERIYNINSVIDTSILNNSCRDIAKQVFDLDENKKYILSGSQSVLNIRKGFKYFLESLKYLEETLSDTEIEDTVILVVSRKFPVELSKSRFKVKRIDYVTDYRLLSLLYQSVDIYINCSIEDSGPMMVSEALACGTPVVGFDMGVVNNMVVTGYNGYKAKLKDSKDLANGITKILKLSDDEFKVYSENAVKKVEEESSFEYATKIFNLILNG